MFSSGNVSLWKDYIKSTGRDRSRSTACVKLRACRIDLFILPIGPHLSNGLSALLRMASYSRYVIVRSFKSFDMPEWKLWGGSHLNIIYTLVDTFTWSKFRISVKQGHFDNEIFLRASFTSLFVTLRCSVVILLLNWSEYLIASSHSALAWRVKDMVAAFYAPSLSYIFHSTQTFKALSSHGQAVQNRLAIHCSSFWHQSPPNSWIPVLPEPSA